MSDEDNDLRCSFCDTPQKDVRLLISAGDNGVYICNECATLCYKLVDKSMKNKSKNKSITEESVIPDPENIKNFLDEHVIGQSLAKEILSVAVSNHYKRLHHHNEEEDDEKKVKIDKSNILLIGPTGVGKTLLAESLSEYLNVPLAIADATSITEAGYYGDDIETIISRLMQEANYDKEKAQRGIVFIDEIDKKSKADGAHSAKDVSGEGVQQALLKMIEGDKVRIPPQGGRKQPNQELIEVDTSNILFILGGAFVGLEDIINKRIDTGTNIGFMASIENKEMSRAENILNHIEPDDLIKFGMIPELVGRMPIYAPLDDLTENQLVDVLTQPKNAIVKQFKELFKYDNIDLEFTEDALKLIARKAKEKRTGARALRTIIETNLIRTQFKLNTLRNSGVEKVIVGGNSVENKDDPEFVYQSMPRKPHPSGRG